MRSNMKSIRRRMMRLHLPLILIVSWTLIVRDNQFVLNFNGIVAADDHVDAKDFEEFLMACSKGDIDRVKEFVQRDTDYYVTAYSKNGGESCLHVAGILGQTTVTQYILQHGGNPNQRSQNVQHGLRMTPLSWNVYGNHIDNVQLLLKAGADVNLDFDYVVEGTLQNVTVFDLLLYIHNTVDLDSTGNTEVMDESNTGGNSNEEKRLYQKTVRAMRDLLLHYGAKRYIDLHRVDNSENNRNVKLEL